MLAETAEVQPGVVEDVACACYVRHFFAPEGAVLPGGAISEAAAEHK